MHVLPKHNSVIFNFLIKSTLHRRCKVILREGNVRYTEFCDMVSITPNNMLMNNLNKCHFYSNLEKLPIQN